MAQKTISLTALMLCNLLAVAGGLAQQNRKPGRAQAMGLERLRILAGTWKSNGERYATDYSKAGKSFATLHNDCWASGEFYACDQIVDGASKSLVIFSVDEKTGEYNSYAIGSQGGAAHHGSLRIEGNTWTYADPPGASNIKVHFRTINVFTQPSVIHYRVEYSRDDKHWTTMLEGVETKQK